MWKSNSATRVLLTLCTFPTHWVSPRQETTASENSNNVSLQSTSINNVTLHALSYGGQLVMRSKRCAVQNQRITLMFEFRREATASSVPGLLCQSGRRRPENVSTLTSLVILGRRRRMSIFLSFLLFYGLMVGKYALICTMEIQKIHVVVHIFSGFALFTELMWVYRGVESLCKLLTANKVLFDLPTKILSILKVVSVESLAGNDFSERGTQAEAHCERNLNRQLWSIRRKLKHRCSRNFCRHYHKSWWR